MCVHDWVHVSVCVWLCECISVWVYSLSAQCVCMTVNVWVCECILLVQCVWLSKCISEWVYQCMSVWVYQCVSVWVCECVSVWVYECVSVWVCECMSVWVYSPSCRCWVQKFGLRRSPAYCRWRLYLRQQTRDQYTEVVDILPQRTSDLISVHIEASVACVQSSFNIPSSLEGSWWHNRSTVVFPVVVAHVDNMLIYISTL